MKYELVRPCKDCPFLRSSGYLTKARARQIATEVISERTFTCHKTNVIDEDGGVRETRDSQHCAGALIFAEKLGRPNQMMRTAERLGMYDASRLDMTADIYSTPAQMAAGHGRKKAAA